MECFNDKHAQQTATGVRVRLVSSAEGLSPCPSLRRPFPTVSSVKTSRNQNRRARAHLHPYPPFPLHCPTPHPRLTKSPPLRTKSPPLRLHNCSAPPALRGLPVPVPSLHALPPCPPCRPYTWRLLASQVRATSPHRCIPFTRSLPACARLRGRPN